MKNDRPCEKARDLLERERQYAALFHGRLSVFALIAAEGSLRSADSPTNPLKAAFRFLLRGD